jgi:periplasmic protein TonB
MTRAQLTRSGPALIVVGLHIVVLYVLSVSLGFVDPPTIVKPSQVVFVPSEPENLEPTKLDVSDPKIAEPDVTVPTPEVMPELPPLDSAPTAEATPTDASTAPTGTLQELRATNRVEPTYPATSRRLGEEGSVQLRVFVDEKGRPQDVAVDRSSGHSRLDQAAISAVKRWRFQPATGGSGPIGTWSRVTITFRLQ